jgi:predicted amidohydrolase YtcJ
MEGEQPNYVEAVVEEKGQIIFVGSKKEAFKNFKNANKHDLKRQTLLPGFIEPHAHPVSIGAFLLAHDIVAPHEWRMPHKTYPAVNGNANYLKAIKQIVDDKTDKTKTVLIWGYHKSWHGELTLKDLDNATGKVPTVIYQRSTHEIYLNSVALKKYDVKESDVKAKNQADFKNNHFWELAYHQVKNDKLKSLFSDKEALKIGMERLSKMMLLNGLTAMAEPGFPITNFDDEYDILKEATTKNPYYSIYLISGFPEQFTLKKTSEDYIKRIESFQKFNTENIKFLKNQFKTFADGAIYSLALQLKDGFHNCPSCHAEWIIPPKMGEELFNFYWDQNYKIHIHITGDLGFEKYLDITERALKRHPRTDHRTTFHHIGLFSAEQAKRAAKLHIEASANPYYLWALADKYSETGFGPERAANMVALNELTKRNVPVSLHSDFAMAPAEPLTLAWVAANRIVASGKIMNEHQKLSVYNAIKGITITAARTINMETKIGSIKKGKEATFTILKENPFKIDAKKIKDISVIGIIYKGKQKLN